MLLNIYNALSPRLRFRIKSLLAAQGHKRTWIDNFKAYHLACNERTLENVTKDIVGALRMLRIKSIEGFSCMEFGAGYVPVVGIVYALLGATRVALIDYNPIAQFRYLRTAVDKSDINRVSILLSPFVAPHLLGDRIRMLSKLDLSNVDSLSSLNIKYVAPFDMNSGIASDRFDFIRSISVLEHVSQHDVVNIIKNLYSSLEIGGIAHHHIDLRDHGDFTKPLKFLSSEDDYDHDKHHDSRGNRLRVEDWLQLFASTPGETELLHCELAPITFVPDRIAKPFQHYSTDQLRPISCTLKTTRTS
jgi:hypothetical protein